MSPLISIDEVVACPPLLCASVLPKLAALLYLSHSRSKHSPGLAQELCRGWGLRKANGARISRVAQNPAVFLHPNAIVMLLLLDAPKWLGNVPKAQLTYNKDLELILGKVYMYYNSDTI